MNGETTIHDGITVRTYRYGFRGGYYATASDTESGEPLSVSGVYFGKGSKRKAIAAALHLAVTDQPYPTDTGCPG